VVAASSHMGRRMQTETGMCEKYTFSGAGYFRRMQERGLYTTDDDAIRARVAATGLAGVMARPVEERKAA
jgi:hypothetical protein